MKPISEHVRFFLALYLKRGRIIRLNPDGYTADRRKVMFEDFCAWCWFPKNYDSDDKYDASGIFWGHIEMEKKYHVCWN